MYWADLTFPPINLHSIPRLPDVSVWEKTNEVWRYEMQSVDEGNREVDDSGFSRSVN